MEQQKQKYGHEGGEEGIVGKCGRGENVTNNWQKGKRQT